MATAGRSLDYAPSLFHHHPTALAHSLARPSHPLTAHYPYRCLAFHHHHPHHLRRRESPTPHLFAHPCHSDFALRPPHRTLHPPPGDVSVSLPTIHYSRTVSFRRTDVVPPAFPQSIYLPACSRSHQRHDTACPHRTERASLSRNHTVPLPPTIFIPTVRSFPFPF